MEMNRRTIRLLLFSCLALVLVVTAIYYIPKIQAAQPTISWGSRGSGVRTLQWRLYQWGYYNGSIDGVFGSSTYNAVVDFQRKNRIRVDGVVGPQTWRALGYEGAGGRTQQVAARGVSRGNDLQLIARLIHAEARAEPFEGKVAVAAVLLNRVQSPSFPNSISGVIYQPLAFESVANGQFNLPPTNDEVRAARSALNGWDPTHGALFFWNPSKPVSSWIWSRRIVRRIGAHVFAH